MRKRNSVKAVGVGRYLAMVAALLFSATSWSQSSNLTPNVDVNTIQKGVLEALPDRPAQIPEDIIPERFQDKIDTQDYQVKFFLKSIEFEGNTLHSDEVLKNLIKDQFGRTHDFGSLVEMARTVTNFYRSQGAFVARTYIPVQSLESQVVRFQIVEGVVEEIDYEYRQKVSGGVVRDKLRKVRKGEVLTQSELERGLLLLNELSGVQAKSFLSPGQEAGTTRLRVLLEQTARYTGFFAVNNHSTESTGRVGGVINLRAENLFRDGGHLEVLGSGSRDWGSYLMGASWFKPLGFRDWSMQLDYNFIATETIDGEFEPLGLSSDNSVARLTFSRPLIRNYTQSLDVQVGGTYELYEQENLSIDERFRDEVGSLFSSLTGSLRDDQGSYQGRFYLEHGLANLGGEASDIFAYGKGRLVQGDFSRLQRLNRKVSLFGRIQGQFSDDRLLSVKQFSAGGSQKVRAFGNSEGLGDKGYSAGFEVRFVAVRDRQWAHWINQIEPYAFFDVGESSNNDPLPGQQRNRTLRGAGAGSRMFFFNKNFSIDAFFGSRVGGDRAVSDDKENQRVWAQAVYFYRF